jgi:hypothetical protein
MQVERGGSEGQPEGSPSGERVSNAWITYLKVWDNSSKGLLIPDVVQVLHGRCTKGETRHEMGPRPIS